MLFRSIVIDIRYAKKANFVYHGSVSTGADSKEFCEGFEAAEFKDFANNDVDRPSFFVFRGDWIRAVEVNRT